ncbi:MAG: hypothetical protein WAU69_10295 [Solirubrobacteraceae bacterium]
MSGGALAASKYLITSTKQISPKVVKQLKGKVGPAGPTGKEGAPGKEGAAGKEGKEGKEGASATKLWAVVEEGGTLARGSGAVEAKSTGTAGDYEVVFNRDVSQCAYEATLGSPTDGSAPAGEIGVAGREEGLFPFFKPKVDAVFVETYNSSGSTTAAPFHLAVFC